MKIKNDLNLHPVISVWLASNTYTGGNSDTSISATGLLRSTRQQVLQRKAIKEDNEMEIDISTLMKSKTGTAIHRCIEESWTNPELLKNACETLGWNEKNLKKINVNPEKPIEGETNVYFEQRAFKDLNGWRINGEFDCVLNGTVIDFKSTSVYTYLNKTKNDDYIKQLSIYRWLNPELITEDVGMIQFIFTDWNQNYTLSNPEYPKHPFVAIQLPLLSLREVEDFISKSLRNIEYYSENIKELPLCDNHTLMTSEVWQYFSKANATKASKNFNSQIEAMRYMASKGVGEVKKKLQEPKGCNYCSCRHICNQYENMKKIGIIK